MGLSIIEAAKLIDRGEANDYISRFVGAVQTAVYSTRPIALNLDDALVASLVLSRLADSAEGRKILKTPKRKNTQYKAEDFGRLSPQVSVASKFVSGEINYPEALNELESAFDKGHIPDRERTLKRLLDDLIDREKTFRSATANALMLAGWDGTEETREEAVRRFLSAFTDDAPGTTK